MTAASLAYRPNVRAPHVARASAESRLLTAALAVYAVLILSISPFALAALGFDYGDAGGNVLTKFHPATFFICFLALAAACGTGDPLSAAVRAFHETPAALFMIGAVLIACAQAIVVTKIPFTPLLETFLPAPLVLLLLRVIPERRGRTLALLLHALLIGNAVLGIGEFLTGWRLTPFVIDGEDLNYEWRATALLGHPLANAMLTGTYIVILAVGGGRDLRPLVRAAAFAICLASMAAFGGRGATVLALLMLALIAGRRLLAVLNGGHLDTRAMMAAIVAVPVAGIGLLLLAHSNFFERILDRFADDTGSAQTRWDMLELVGRIPFSDFVFAPDHRQVLTWQGILGLERGIESFWLSMALSYGLIVAGLVFAALFAHGWTIVRRCRPGAVWPLLYFLAVATTSLSLGGKSSVLTIATFLVLVLLRPFAPARALPAAAYLARRR
ncbi:VpsF family polysaccharide biosynthesis protein [Hyphomicrobium sp.]|uniref:VpsF family polysaccharide biosynthesis protein n=1 Tax=Hyphomicrobium sp. TaxID=82 RepID=UPI003F6FE2A1